MSSRVALEKRRSGQKLTSEERPGVQAKFLAKFRRDANMSLACRHTGVSRTSVYRWVDRDIGGFAAEYRDAEEDAKDAIRAEIYRRGVTGWKEPVFYKGVKVDSIRKFSDVLLIFEAKRRMPDEYRESPQAVAQAVTQNLIQIGDAPPKAIDDMTEEELAVAIPQLEAEVGDE